MKITFLNIPIQSISIFLFILIFIQYNGYCQTQQLEERNLILQFNAGPTLFWGDMSDDVSQPFEKFFTKQQKYSFGLNGMYLLHPAIAAEAGLSYGSISGIRKKWSNNLPANMKFKGNYLDYQLGMRIDPIALFFQSSPLNKFSFITHIAFGGVTFRSVQKNLLNDTVLAFEGYKDKNLVKSTPGFSWFIPVTPGFVYRINPKFSIHAETSFRFALTDRMDAFDSKFTDVYDIYTFTSLGVSYSFKTRSRSQVPKFNTLPQMNEDSLLISQKKDSVLAATNKNKPEVIVEFPDTIKQNESFFYTIRIYKASISGNAHIQQTFPFGMKVEAENIYGEFRFRDQIVNIEWNPLPEEPIFTVKCKAVATQLNPGNYSVPGIMFYNVDKIERILQFKTTFTVKAPPKPVEVAVTPIKQSETKEKEEIISPTNLSLLPPSARGLEYRVQVRAIYGGLESPNRVKNMYHLTTEVYEDQHKGYTKYTTGSFKTYDEAAALKNQLRADNRVPDAFVVAFYNGERLNSLEEAKSLSQQSTPAVTNVSSSPSPSTVTAEGLTFRIQLGAMGKPVSSSYFRDKYGIYENIKEEYHNGLYKYTTGEYSSKEAALSKLSEIRLKIPDAFIVRYLNGVRQ